MHPVVELNGRQMALAEAQVPVTDLGVLYGIGLFETLRAYCGRAFRLRAHLDRLCRSARALSLPLDPKALPDEPRIQALLQANELHEARLRITVTGGAPTEQGPRPGVLVTAVAFEPYPQELYDRGITAAITTRRQSRTDPLAGHKSTHYWTRLQTLHEAQLQGCGEALWFNDAGQLAEGCISNVFVVKDATAKTPAPDTPVLPGITRAAILECCAALHVAHQETALSIADLLDADEAFICNSMMEIVPVCRVERSAVGTEQVGPVTRRLAQAYRATVQRECGVD